MKNNVWTGISLFGPREPPPKELLIEETVNLWAKMGRTPNRIQLTESTGKEPKYVIRKSTNLISKMLHWDTSGSLALYELKDNDYWQPTFATVLIRNKSYDCLFVLMQRDDYKSLFTFKLLLPFLELLHPTYGFVYSGGLQAQAYPYFLLNDGAERQRISAVEAFVKSPSLQQSNRIPCLFEINFVNSIQLGLVRSGIRLEDFIKERNLGDVDRLTDDLWQWDISGSLGVADEKLRAAGYVM